MISLAADALHYRFPGGAEALRGLTLPIAPGRRLAILGPNGAGKSTLLLHLNGSLKPQSGRVLLDGQAGDYSRAGLLAWRRRVGLVLQNPDDQLFAASVFEDVSFGPLNLGLSDVEARQRVDEALTALDIQDLRDRPTHMLSGGQKKRVAIAGILAMRPDILLLDEPTAGLDQAATDHLVTILEQLAASGVTLVFSTHDVDLAWRLAQDVALFAAGSVHHHGPAAEILSQTTALAVASLRPPLLIDIALKARALGLLAADAPLPRDADQLLASIALGQGGAQPGDLAGHGGQMGGFGA